MVRGEEREVLGEEGVEVSGEGGDWGWRGDWG